MTAPKNDFHDDDLSDLLGGRPLATAPVTLPATYKAPDHSEPCKKCRGSGYWRPGYPCFACKGKGHVTFKTSPAQRAKSQASNQRRQERKAQAVREEAAAWTAANPEIVAWIASSRDFPFAVAMAEAIVKFGSLTENQTAACQRCIDSRKRAQEARALRESTAPAVDTAGIDRLKAAFEKAATYTATKAKGLTVRNPKITVGGMTISPAKAASQNAGALYVKVHGGEYLGKIVNGRFFGSAVCTNAQREQILKFIADPAEAAKVYGQETGVCCVCNVELRSEWRLRGIGPICAQKFGW